MKIVCGVRLKHKRRVYTFTQYNIHLSHCLCMYLSISLEKKRKRSVINNYFSLIVNVYYIYFCLLWFLDTSSYIKSAKSFFLNIYFLKQRRNCVYYSSRVMIYACCTTEITSTIVRGLIALYGIIFFKIVCYILYRITTVHTYWL